ncbi:hypothetical protein FRX31_007612 [Thalictrum thalictroides]|uniref:Uncharacterized protein n=1 Tax=Thalictrum thalictroides TaxID=46969 RepID=A0A7J6X0D9_THATH|nr:hypothetical protein FRX31_007612 [Thalictrum thalictroides]
MDRSIDSLTLSFFNIDQRDSRTVSVPGIWNFTFDVLREVTHHASTHNANPATGNKINKTLAIHSSSSYFLFVFFSALHTSLLIPIEFIRYVVRANLNKVLSLPACVLSRQA